MVNMKTVLIIFISLCLYSCTLISKATRNVKRNFPCYDSQFVQSDSLLCFDCIYRLASPTTRYKIIKRSGFLNLNIKMEEVQDTLYINIMFFKDGMVIYNFNASSIYEDMDSRSFYKWYKWGHYKIFNDIVKIYYVVAPDDIFRNADVYGELSFKIVNRNNISYIGSGDSTYIYYATTTVSLNRIPDSDLCWLKKEKWFWCSKEDWKKYMQQIEQKKIKKQKK
jgi:hypothetical protein